MDDYQSRMVLNQKYSDIDRKYNAAIEELNRGKIRNSELSSELLQLEQLIFQQKSETKDEPIIQQDMLFDYMKYANDDVGNPAKIQMQYFKKLVDLTSAITERITKDYKLNPENSLDMLISEMETSKLSLIELNGIKEANNGNYDDLKAEQIKLCNQFGKEVSDFNYVIEGNNFTLDRYKKNLEHLEAKYQSKENELAGLTAYLTKLSSDEKSLEIQCESLKENGRDV